MPGSVYLDTRTRRWYWAVKLPDWPRRKTIPLVPPGERYATRDRRAAELRRLALWAQWHRPEAPDAPRSGLSALLAAFQATNAVTASPAQARANRRMVEAFIRDRGVVHVTEFTAAAVQAHLLALAGKRAARTVHHHKSALSAFCRWAVREGHLQSNPATSERVSVPRATDGPPGALTVPQVGRLLRAVRHDRRLYAAVVLALETGARLGELVALRAEDVRDGAVIIGATRPTKTGGWRSVPLSARVARIVRRYGLPDWQHRWWIVKLREAVAGMPSFNARQGRRSGRAWHLLRSTWATSMAAGRSPFGRPLPEGRGLNLWEVMQRGGWTTPQTAMRYLSLAGAVG